MEFNLTEYKDALIESQKKGYEVVNFQSALVNNNERKILIRHDVDFSLDQAVEIAKIEASLNVSATYFIRFHCKFYNALSIDSKNKILNIENLGHSVGLHFEEDFYKKDMLYNGIKTEKYLLDSFLDNEVDAIAPHEPSRTGRMEYDLQELLNIGIKYQAYDGDLLNKYTYMSDSSGILKDGFLKEHVEKGTKNIYILTHPVWWYQNTPIEVY